MKNYAYLCTVIIRDKTVGHFPTVQYFPTYTLLYITYVKHT